MHNPSSAKLFMYFLFYFGRQEDIAVTRFEFYDICLNNGNKFQVNMTSFTFCIVALAVIMNVKGIKILLLPTPAAKSHVIELLGTGEEMAKRGHKVSVYLPAFTDTGFLKHSLINVISYDFKEEFKNLLENGMMNIQAGNWKPEAGILDNIWIMKDIKKGMCWGLFSDKEGIEKLSREQFDLALVSALPFTECLFCLPYYLNIPTVAAGAFILGTQSGMPLQTGIFPIFKSSSDDHTFTETFVESVVQVLFFLIYPAFFTMDVSGIDPRLSDVDPNKVVASSILFLENSDSVFDRPKAIFPNFIQVGGVTARLPKPLDKSLEEFVARSPKGIILVSFGTAVPYKFAPKPMMKILLNALHEQEYNVLMKSETDYEDGNVKFSKWFSQNDILGHPKTKLFISHCGKNGVFESIFHGVPILCAPRAIDQPSNARRVEELQIGKYISLESASLKQVLNSIYDVLYNETYRENIKRLSEIFRDRPDTPAQRAANAIEHVLKYGSDHLTPPTKHLTTIQYVYADIWFTLYIFLSICLYLIYKCCDKVIKSMYRSTKVKRN